MKNIRKYTTMAVILTLLFGINTLYAAPYYASSPGHHKAYSHAMVSPAKATTANPQLNGIVEKKNEPCGQQATIIPMGNGQGIIFINGKGTFVDGFSLSNRAQELACS
ncbi:MAG: hypothetical protein M0036_03415 [Desulfobacteraceae bacterium]|nr:hypothetical protein [Desulfobacteraceae bacterium]